MRSWLLEYEEWIILGLGIVLVTLVIGLVAVRITRRRAAQAAPPPPPSPSAPRVTPQGIVRPEAAMALPAQPRSELAVLALQGTRPRLQEILEQLRHAPRHQREALLDSFFGFPVTCAGEVRSIVKLPSGKVLIDLMADESGEDVFLEVFPSTFPALDFSQPGLRLVANGRFRSSTSSLWLDDPELLPTAGR